MNYLEAYKMDGLGNDFIIFDKRKNSISLTKDQIIKISKRDNIGCDQVIFINNDKNTDAFLEFYNSDGGEVSACGNGSRCVADFLMKEKRNKKISLRTKAGILYAEINDKNLVSINMGKPHFEWEKIPLLKKLDNENLQIKIKNIDGNEIKGGFSLSVGNPHLIFFVEELYKFNLEDIGPTLENHIYFPEKCNVTLASIKNKSHLKIKVWERGAGITKACGTAACAASIAGSVLNLVNRCTNVEFKEGFLNIDWRKDNSIYMSGKVSQIKNIKVNI